MACIPPADLLCSHERRRIRTWLCADFGPGEPRPTKEATKRDNRRATIGISAGRRGGPQPRWSYGHAVQSRISEGGSEESYQSISVIPNDVGSDESRLLPVDSGTYARADCEEFCHCQGDLDTADHMLFECPYWSGHHDELGACFGHWPSTADLQDILCGAEFEGLLVDPDDKSIVLSNTEEVFRLFYKMVKTILSLKEKEERVWQATERRVRSPDPNASPTQLKKRLGSTRAQTSWLDSRIAKSGPWNSSCYLMHHRNFVISLYFS